MLMLIGYQWNDSEKGRDAHVYKQKGEKVDHHSDRCGFFVLSGI